MKIEISESFFDFDVKVQGINLVVLMLIFILMLELSIDRNVVCLFMWSLGYSAYPNWRNFI